MHIHGKQDQKARMVLGELNDTVPHIKARQKAEIDARAMTTQWPERHPEEAGEGINCTMHSSRLLSMTMGGGFKSNTEQPSVLRVGYMEGTLSTGMVGQRSLSRMRKWQWWLGKETETL